MKEIFLRGRNGLGKVAKVDDDDYEKVNAFKWCYNKGNGYASRSTYDKVSKRRGHITMHRFITNAKYIDHIDCDKLNNQKSNLRSANPSQNSFNLSKRKGTTSKYKGVNWYRAYSKWMVMLQKNRKRYFVGYFDDEDEAGQAYNDKAKELFGEFAKLNRIRDISTTLRQSDKIRADKTDKDRGVHGRVPITKIWKNKRSKNFMRH